MNDKAAAPAPELTREQRRAKRAQARKPTPDAGGSYIRQGDALVAAELGPDGKLSAIPEAAPAASASESARKPRGAAAATDPSPQE